MYAPYRSNRRESSDRSLVSANTVAAARAGLKWGVTPKGPRDKDAVPGPDHPVHKIPLEKQEKMRKKGINPVLYAEMNQNNFGEKGFWAKVRGTSMGGGWIK
jgi:hypothetical protein